MYDILFYPEQLLQISVLTLTRAYERVTHSGNCKWFCMDGVGNKREWVFMKRVDKKQHEESILFCAQKPGFILQVIKRQWKIFYRHTYGKFYFRNFHWNQQGCKERKLHSSGRWWTFQERRKWKWIIDNLVIEKGEWGGIGEHPWCFLAWMAWWMALWNLPCVRSLLVKNFTHPL